MHLIVFARNGVFRLREIEGNSAILNDNRAARSDEKVLHCAS
ncbi:MAG: hypothetical protein QOD84_2680 [Acidobacteriaceae bacterium]|jgi:hypothetical protein